MDSKNYPPIYLPNHLTDLTSRLAGTNITAFIPAAYQRRSLRRVLRYLVLGPVWRLDAFSASQLPA